MPRIVMVDDVPHRVAELTVDVNGIHDEYGHTMEGEFKTWPSHIQDRILNALSIHNLRTGLTFTIKEAICDHIPEGWFVHVVAIAPIPPGKMN